MVKLSEYSWKDVEEMCFAISERIKEKPDCLVGLSRGGLPIAGIISDIKDIKKIYSLGIKCYQGNERGAPEIYQELKKADIEGKNVLLVDDLVDSGQNMQVAIEHIKQFNPKKIETAVLFKKSWSKTTPDYFIKEDNSWAVFPWEKYETQRHVKV